MLVFGSGVAGSEAEGAGVAGFFGSLAVAVIGGAESTFEGGSFASLEGGFGAGSEEVAAACLLASLCSSSEACLGSLAATAVADFSVRGAMLAEYQELALIPF